LNTVFSSSDGVSWAAFPAPPFAARYGLGCVVFGQRMYVLGGRTPNVGGTFFGDVWSTADGVSWRQEAAKAPWSARAHHEVIVFRGKIWILGGDTKHQSLTTDKGDTWYSPDGKNWFQAPGAEFTRRAYASAVVINPDEYWNRVMIVGGTNDDTDGLQDSWASF
jgi:hypothetical protein